MKKFLISAESVTEGHPDKIADQIADAILDEILKKDKYARVACEILTGMSYVVIGGEITTKSYVDTAEIARSVVKDIGYNKPEYGFDYHTLTVFNSINRQSPDIAAGVKKTGTKKQGSGDQGIMIGYACNETRELMPLPIVLCHKLVKRLAELRKNNSLSFLRPDGKSQIALEYRNGRIELKNVIISTQHDPTVKIEELRETIIAKVIKPVCEDYLTKTTKFYINNTGRFVVGGPVSDTGMTGRKIVVDSYGPLIPIGGGGMSGKDPTKLDRAGAYIARYIAKNIVAAGLADKCLARLSYVIAGAHPTEVSIDTFGTAKISEEKINKAILKVFDLSPGGIINELRLLRPIYRKTACYGHFGKKELPWEKTDKVKQILKVVR